MGSFIEINDSLVISADQGFPDQVFNIKKHQENPITIDDVKDRTFTFFGKENPRFYQLDPVRVFLYQYLNNAQGEPKWLAWGEVLIQSQCISKIPGADHQGANNMGDPKQWQTAGTFKMLKVFPPEYQKIFTEHETPPDMSYFIE